MAQKQSNRNSNKPKEEAKLNTVPDLVFRPFKSCKRIVVALCFLSMAICVGLLYYAVSSEKALFDAEKLGEIANVALNIILVVGALGLSIFLLPIKSEQQQKEKEKLLIRYVGNTLVLAAVTILGYIMSFCTMLLPPVVFSIYSVAMLITLCSCLIRTVSTMMAYFNIRD